MVSMKGKSCGCYKIQQLYRQFNMDTGFFGRAVEPVGAEIPVESGSWPGDKQEHRAWGSAQMQLKSLGQCDKEHMREE